MDLLESLNVGELQEQQTRTLHLKKILLNNDEESTSNLRLGFNSCCYCACKLHNDDDDDNENDDNNNKNNKGKNKSRKKEKQKVVECKGCHRVKYCSIECLEKDSSSLQQQQQQQEEEEEEEDQEEEETTNYDDHDDDDAALGHTSIICALLRLCNDDEIVEEQQQQNSLLKSSTKLLSNDRIEKSKDRIRSEYESYPATLANILSEVPCYQQTILEKQNNNTLVIHIIGASIDAEITSIQQNNGDDNDNNFDSSYKEAFTGMMETYNINIHLCFVGPECPKINVIREKHCIEEQLDNDNDDNNNNNNNSKKKQKKKKKNRFIMFDTRKCTYDRNNNEFLFDNDNNNTKNTNTNSIPKPNVVVFFNPGFTCNDYKEWNTTLNTIRSLLQEQQQHNDNNNNNCGNGIPFLVTTNTEMEGINDCQYLYNHNYISSLPRVVSSIIGNDDDNDNDIDDNDNDIDGDDDNDSDNDMFFSFFGENPYAGSRIRQSGTMANDLYVKNRWMFGGFLSSSSSKDNNDEKQRNNNNNNNKKNTKMTTTSSNDDDTTSNSNDNSKSNNKKKLKKRKKETSSNSNSNSDGYNNTKKRNPALI